MTKRIVGIKAFVSALLIALLMLAGCGGAGGSATPKEDPNLGLYKISSLMDMSEEEFIALLGEDFRNEFTLELKEDGKADFTVSGDLQTMNYSIEGDKLTLTSENSETIEGTIADGHIKLEIDDGSMEFRKYDPNAETVAETQAETVKETEAPATEAATTEAAETEAGEAASETAAESGASETETAAESESKQ